MAFSSPTSSFPRRCVGGAGGAGAGGGGGRGRGREMRRRTGALRIRPSPFTTRRPRKLSILLVTRGRGALAAGSTGAPPGTSGEQTREADLPHETITAPAQP